MDDNGAARLGRCDHRNAHQVGGKSGPGGIVNFGHSPAKIRPHPQLLLSVDHQRKTLARRSGQIFLQPHAHAKPVGKDHLHHAQMLGHHPKNPQLPRRNCTQPDVAAHFDKIRADVRVCAVQLAAAMDRQHIAADPVDRTAHHREHPTEILHMGFAGGVAQHRSPLRQCSSHDPIFGCSHRRLVKQQIAAPQPSRRTQFKLAVVAQAAPQSGQHLKMGIDAPPPDVVAACRSVDLKIAKTRQQRPHQRQRPPNLGKEPRVRLGSTDFARTEGHCAPMILHLNPQPAQNPQHRFDIADAGQVVERDRLFGQQRGGQHGQRSVFVAGRTNRTL